MADRTEKPTSHSQSLKEEFGFFGGFSLFLAQRLETEGNREPDWHFLGVNHSFKHHLSCGWCWFPPRHILTPVWTSRVIIGFKSQSQKHSSHLPPSWRCFRLFQPSGQRFLTVSVCDVPSLDKLTESTWDVRWWINSWRQFSSLLAETSICIHIRISVPTDQQKRVFVVIRPYRVANWTAEKVLAQISVIWISTWSPGTLAAATRGWNLIGPDPMGSQIVSYANKTPHFLFSYLLFRLKSLSSFLSLEH